TDAGKRIVALEFGVAQPGKARDIRHAESAVIYLVRWLDARLQHPRDGSSGALCPYREEAEGGRVAFVGPVEYFPVPQLAAAAERNRSRTDAAQREGDHPELSSFIDVGVRGNGCRRTLTRDGSKTRRPGQRHCASHLGQEFPPAPSRHLVGVHLLRS